MFLSELFEVSVELGTHQVESDDGKNDYEACQSAR